MVERGGGEGGRSVDVPTRDLSTLPGPFDTQQLPDYSTNLTLCSINKTKLNSPKSPDFLINN